MTFQSLCAELFVEGEGFQEFLCEKAQSGHNVDCLYTRVDIWLKVLTTQTACFLRGLRITAEVPVIYNLEEIIFDIYCVCTLVDNEGKTI